MLPIRLQFFFTFSIMGSLLPYLSVYLEESKGLNEAKVGTLFSTGGVAIFITPLIVTFLADKHLSPRRLMTFLFFFVSLASLGLAWFDRFEALLAVILIQHLALVPVVPLQDGINFAYQKQREAAGLKSSPYHRMRFWGSLGFMAPSFGVWVLMRMGGNLEVTIYLAAVMAMLGSINTLFLPETSVRTRVTIQADPDTGQSAGSRAPTAAALRAMLEPHVFVFCLAMLFAAMATSSYYMMYPAYLKQKAGIAPEWFGIISSIGVFLELPVLIGFGALVARFGFKRLLELGMLITALRMALLWLFPNPAVAIGTQLLHGTMVMVIHISPPIFLNRHARDENRNSMQGMYAMVVIGVGRIAGQLLGGALAEIDLQWMFASNTVLCVLAAGLFLFAFADKQEADDQ